MQELRWILLAAGIALIVALYVLGVRARRRSAAPGLGRATRVEAPPLSGIESPRIEPRVDVADDAALDFEAPATAIDEVPIVDFEVEPEPEPAAASEAHRREPIPEVHRPDPIPAVHRREPTFAAPADAPRPAPPPRDASAPRQRQKIIALRVTAPAPERFEGAFLEEALRAEGFAFGRFGIFHRLDAAGRPILSLASLLEPGTFDPATMARCSYPGVALFAVLPGPVSAPQALEELVESGRYLAERLGGSLLDDRGAALSVQRIGQLREEVLDFERGHAASRGA
ncbi:MAG: hypothetical protein KBE42_02930 [Steroidobacteraceae bacterium]|nr:hypothetical protein [Steroidobacteraceae bacterium]